MLACRKFIQVGNTPVSAFLCRNTEEFVEACRFEKLQRKELIMRPAQPGPEVSAPWT